MDLLVHHLLKMRILILLSSQHRLRLGAKNMGMFKIYLVVQ